MQRKLMGYVRWRLSHIAMLWLGIWLASYAVPVGIALLNHADPSKAQPLDISEFMD